MALLASSTLIKADSTVYKVDDYSKRYLVMGLTGNSNDVNVWSYTSGGATGAPVPTSDDQCIADANSLIGASGNLTIAANFECGGWDTSALTKNLTLTASVYTLSLYGNLTENATYSLYNLTGTSYFYIKGNCTITTNGRATHAWNRLYIDAAGCTVTNADAMTFGNNDIYLNNGTWDTNNKNIDTAGATNGVGTRTLTLGSSLFKARNFNFGTTGFTFNYNTSTVQLYYGTTSGGYTFYNLSLILHTTASLSLSGNNTINNQLTITGVNSGANRGLVGSDTLGTSRSITIVTGAPTPIITNCDFQDIHIHNTDADPLDLSAQTDIGNCGGNTGITFPPALNLYIVHTSGAMSVSNAAKWKLVDLVSAGRVPLPQDSAFGVAGSFTGASTVTMDCPRIGSLDLSAVNQAVGWTLANAISCYGHYVLGNNITQSGNYTCTMMTRTAANLDLYGKTIYDLVINALGGTVTFLSAFIFRLFTQTNGTIIMGTFTYESNLITALTAWTYTAGTVTPETSTIKFNPTSDSVNITFVGGGKVYNNIWFSGAHTGNFDITGANAFNNIKIDAGRKVRFTAGTTTTLSSLTAVGTALSIITIDSVTDATHTLNYTGTDYSQCDYLSLKNSHATADKLYASNSTNVGNNTGWVFALAESIDFTFTEEEVMSGLLLAWKRITVTFTESEEQVFLLLAKAYLIGSLTEAEELNITPMAKAYFTSTFLEAEDMSALLKAFGHYTIAFTEVEQIQLNALMGLGHILSIFDESEILFSTLLARAHIIEALQDIENMDLELVAKAFVHIGFTESEIMSVLIGLWLIPRTKVTGRIISNSLIGRIINNSLTGRMQ